MHPRSELPWRGLKAHRRDLSHTVLRQGLQGPRSFPSCPAHSTDLREKRMSRSLLGTGNYPGGPLGPILSGCTLTLPLNPSNKASVIPSTGPALIRAQTHSDTDREINKTTSAYIWNVDLCLESKPWKCCPKIHVHNQRETIYTVRQYLYFHFQEMSHVPAFFVRYTI